MVFCGGEVVCYEVEKERMTCKKEKPLSNTGQLIIDKGPMKTEAFGRKLEAKGLETRGNFFPKEIKKSTLFIKKI